MRYSTRFGITAGVLLLGVTNLALALSDKGRIANVFAQYGQIGTLVVSSINSGKRYVYNPERAAERFSPASTFKIPNTLIALEKGLVSSQTVFDWDGEQHQFQAWNKDQSLQSAFRISCVWCYQKIARQLGAEVYQRMLKELGYGNKTIGNQVDMFWLDGSLAISAEEQIEFLTRLATLQLPLEINHQNQTKSIMLDEQGQGYRLYGKTGRAANGIDVGWYVGLVERENETWVFAMNMPMKTIEQAAMRKSIVLEALRELGILSSEPAATVSE